MQLENDFPIANEELGMSSGELRYVFFQNIFDKGVAAQHKQKLFTLHSSLFTKNSKRSFS